MSARLKPYPSYRDSGVKWLGRIPAQWQVKRIKFVAPACDVKLAEKPNGSTYVGLENIESKTGRLLLDAPAEVVDSTVVEFRRGDVLFGKLRPYLAKVARPDFDGVATTELLVLRPQDGLEAQFLTYRLLAPDCIELINSFTYGVKMPRANGEQVGGLAVAWPSLEEQRAVAVFLDRETGKIDALVKKNERLIELLQEKRTALISHAVTKGLSPNAPMKDSGVPWLGQIPALWELKKLGQVARIVRGGSPRPAGDPRFFDGDACPWITVAEITKDSGKFLVETETRLTEEGRRHSRFLKAGTLVMSNSGATLGVPKILNISGCINDGSVAFLDLNPSVSRNHLYYYLASLTDNYRQRIKQGSGQPNLNTAIVRATWLPIADVAEQVRIVQFLDREAAKLDALMAKVRTAIERLQEYRTALISAAVTGQIDVRSGR